MEALSQLDAPIHPPLVQRLPVSTTPTPSRPEAIALWEAHLGMARSIVRDSCYLPELREDALQEVMLGLWEAVQHRDEALADAFGYYAWVSMRKRLFAYLLFKATERPRLTKTEMALMASIRAKMRAGMALNCATIDKLASEAGMSRFRLTQLLSVWHYNQMVVSATAMQEFEELVAPQVEDDDEGTLTRLASAMATLKDREAEIVRARFLSDPKQTLEDLAALYGVSPERIRQIETAAIKKLRAVLVER